MVPYGITGPKRIKQFSFIFLVFKIISLNRLFINIELFISTDSAVTVADTANQLISRIHNLFKFESTIGDMVCTRRQPTMKTTNMVTFTAEKKAYCDSEFAKCESVVTVQWRFRAKSYIAAPKDKTSMHGSGSWLCVAKRTGLPGPLAETVEHVRETFARSPKKSERGGSATFSLGHFNAELAGRSIGRVT